MKSITIYSDGGARGNPGPAGIGYVILGENLNQHFGAYIGEATNNIAEHLAIYRALKNVHDKKIETENINCFLDSELVVKQLRGEYKIKNLKLKTIAFKTIAIVESLKNKGIKINFEHIPREENKQADSLVNQALDDALL